MIANLNPSYRSGFARNAGESLHPNQWEGLVGVWSPLLGPTGLTLFDHSRFKNHGTLTNFTLSNAFKISNNSKFIIGHTLEFDGVNDFVDIGNAFTPGTKDFSITTWAKLNIPSGDANPVLIGKGSTGATEWMLRVAAADDAGTAKIDFFGAAGAARAFGGNGSFKNNTWTHVVVTRLGSLLTVYQDGIEIGSDATASDDLSSSANIRIGDANAGDRVWDGQISDLRIYDRSLSSTEINQIYRTGVSSLYQKKKRNVVAVVAVSIPDSFVDAEDKSIMNRTGMLAIGAQR